jgi:hypothetical protein
MQPEHESKIGWLDWTDEAFQRAKAEKKLVLLDISAVWCHWCHRLDKDTYSVSDIAEYIQANFIPIRVDTDKRPDINRRYNLGGWPTTAFLTPDGRVIGGGTYFPPDQMRQLLRDIKSSWQKSQGNPPEGIPLPEPEKMPAGELSNSIVEEIIGEVANNFDPIYGGFGSEPKFPNTEAQELVLLKYHYTRNREFLGIVLLTLNNAGRSGTYDKEMGGFFRYSTARDWSIPHFEKMSEDNAKWLQLYLHAYQSTADPFYAAVSKGIVDYVNAWLRDQEQGCFYGSQDADEEYYKLSKAERLKTKPPFVDKRIYTNWNAMMISAYLDASFTLADPLPREFALKSLDRLLLLNFKRGEGMYHFYDDKPQVQNQLADQIQTANALCRAFECTGERKYLKTATELLNITVTKLHDPELGGFFDTVVDPNAPGFLSKPTKPLEENSPAARVLTKLYHLTGEQSYRTYAEDTLKRFADSYLSFGFSSAEYALAVDAFLNEPSMIQIVGSPDKPQTKGLLAEANRIYEPRKIVQTYDPREDAKEIETRGYSVSDTPTAYICVGTACTAAITEPKQIAPSLQQMIVSNIKH